MMKIKPVMWIMAALLGMAVGLGCLATEQDMLEEEQAGALAAPGDECIAGEVDADGDVCTPGTNRCCVNDSSGGRACRGGSRFDTEAECLANGGVKFYTNGGECERLCASATVAEPIE
jgi:hypothetical protein